MGYKVGYALNETTLHTAAQIKESYGCLVMPYE